MSADADVLYSGPAGSMLSYFIHSLLLLPVRFVRPLLHDLLSLLPHLDKLNAALPTAAVLEAEELSWSSTRSVAAADSSDSEAMTPSWTWLIDVERACTLLIGRCLGGMLMGIPLSPEEIKCHCWMNSALFSNGAEPLDCDIGTAINIDIGTTIDIYAIVTGPPYGPVLFCSLASVVCNAAGRSGVWAVGRPTLHGGPVWLRPFVTHGMLLHYEVVATVSCYDFNA